MYCGYSQGWAIYCGTLHVEGGLPFTEVHMFVIFFFLFC